MEEKTFVTGSFYEDSLPLHKSRAPVWGMSLKLAGNMRFRWNETNPVRANFLKKLAEENGSHKDIAALELVHSQKVFAIDSIEELDGRQGDGIITRNKNIIPVVTVADCMPIFLYEPESGVFGALHSGWRGTGIVREAIEKAHTLYGSDPEKFCVVMGPHIHECCYKVNEERASYFRVNFTPACVTPDHIIGKGANAERRFSLSLAKANLSILSEMGVRDSNIVVCKDCTCCNSQFGSFRRETFGLPDSMSLEEKQKHFTVQAAWVKWD